MTKTVFVVMAGAVALVLLAGCGAEPTTAEASCPPCPTCPAGEECPACPTCEPCPECMTQEPCPTCPAPIATISAGASSTFALEFVKLVDPAPPSEWFEGTGEGVRLIAVVMKVTNVGEKVQGVNSYYAFIVDSDGRVYEPSVGGSDVEQLPLVDLAPGENCQGAVDFVIPDDATPARIKFASGVISSEYAYADIP
jgi:hypothetical protein